MLQNSDLFPSLQGFSRIFKIDAEELVRRLVEVAVILFLAWLALYAISVIARRIVEHADDGDDSTLTEAEQRGATIAQLVRGVGKVVVYSVTFLLVLNVFVNIGPLLAGAGILGLAFSFGAQSLVKDVIAGFFILVENQFAVGDVIEISGKSGSVERMTLRVTVLRDGEGTMHVVPNSAITTVSNKTRLWSRAVVDIGVSYDDDVDRVIEVLRSEATALAADAEWKPKLDGEPEVLGVEQLGDRAVVIRTQVRTHAGAQWEVARELRRRFKRRLVAEGLENPVIQRIVEVRAPRDSMA
ncbi:MAG TPA: mechanosensitive ion channel domain-containing protein [Gemmatimonadales bacterium]|nr:mechanosensitive ion channel domain-containing protein [Gemmatimonadales bacterium]